MDLASFGRALRKRWWYVVVAVVLGTAISTVLTLRSPKEYASSVTFFVSTPGSANGTALQADQFAQLRVNSYVNLLSSEQLAKLVLTQPGVGDLTPKQVISTITATAPSNTVVLTATVTDTLPRRSLAIAGAIGATFPGMVNSLDPPSSRTVLKVVSGPTLNTTPVSPRKTLDIGLGVLIGLAIGLAVTFLRELIDKTMRTPQDLEAASGLAVLGSVAFDKAVRTEPLIVGARHHSLRAEEFRRLRTNLQFVDVDHPTRVVVVTSSVPSEGKSTTAANLAIAFAESEQRVLLIEADLRRPRVTEYLGVERAVGLTNVLAEQLTIDEALQPWGDSKLTVLPSGHIPPNPSELLGSERMRALLDQLRERFDMIIVDTPPLLPVTDAAVASRHADATVVVVRCAKTRRDELVSAVRSLNSVDARVVGAIFNMEQSKKKRSDGYGAYGYRDDEPETGKGEPAPAHAAEKTDDRPTEKKLG